MNNKELGTNFENLMCEKLAKEGWWIHFINPNKSGAQPFDIIAVKDGFAMVGDCKTSADKTFRISRLEDNQIMAFEKWLSCGNSMPYVFILYDGNICCIPYGELKATGKVDLTAWRI